MLRFGSPHVYEGPNSAAHIQALRTIWGTLIHSACLRHHHVSVVFRCHRQPRVSQMAMRYLTCALGVLSLTVANGLLVLHLQDCMLGNRDCLGFLVTYPSNFLPVPVSSCVWGHNFELTHCACLFIVAKCCPCCNFDTLPCFKLLYRYFKIKDHTSVLKCRTI